MTTINKTDLVNGKVFIYQNKKGSNVLEVNISDCGKKIEMWYKGSFMTSFKTFKAMEKRLNDFCYIQQLTQI